MKANRLLSAILALGMALAPVSALAQPSGDIHNTQFLRDVEIQGALILRNRKDGFRYHIKSVLPAQETTLSIQDPGASTANLLTSGANTLTGTQTFTASPIFPTTGIILQGTSFNQTIKATASQAQASTYTISDIGASTGNIWTMTNLQTTAGVIKRADLNVELYDKFPIYLQEVRNNDGTVLDATGGASKFKIVNGGVGVGTLTLAGETANNNTKTDTFCKEMQLMDEYNAGGNIALDVSCQYFTAGAPTLTTKTLTVTCFLQNNDGTVTAVPLTGGVITLTSANVLSTVTVTTPGTFTPGQRLLFYFQSVLTETASVNANAQINGINLKYDVKG